MRSRAKTATLFLSVALHAISKAQVEVAWISELDQNAPSLGLNGPWQALLTHYGSKSYSSYLWPSGEEITYIVANTSQGAYAFEDSQSATRVDDGLVPQPPHWRVAYNTTSGQPVIYGYTYFDNIGYPTQDTVNTIHLNSFNESVAVLNDSILTTPDGRAFQNEVGILGLGRAAVSHLINDDPWVSHPSLLDQLKEQNTIINSSSFGMHMGSAQHDQLGSLVLGGYDQSRALGQPGIFKINDDLSVNVFLVDVWLGTQVGASAFNIPHNQDVSVYPGLDSTSDAARYVKYLGGTRGSAWVALAPSVPYIYLPPGTCETAAQYLPVTWNASLELFLWNEDDPRYSRIVKSPAYMAFILADSNGKNLTVKVPFQLLNLTLSPPLVEKSRPYFPCKPLDYDLPLESVRQWLLGRAFMQAAFYGANYDTGTIFLAQGPGPNMDTKVVKIINEIDTSISTNSIDSFERTWSPYWKALDPLPGPVPTRPPSTPIPDDGKKVVIALVTILGGLNIIGFSFLLWRRNRRNRRNKDAGEKKEKTENLDTTKDNPATMQEADASQNPADLSDPLAHEMTVPNVIHEASHEPLYYELPASHVSDRPRESPRRSSY
ncbi:aspartic peptidase domain-containing protein [Nemania sp. FL0916]|nr:aspartic peptidase domain-containing protein [Nemania sp. FL0916]